MTEIVLLAILVLAFVGVHYLGAREGDAISRTWPLARAEFPRSEPVDEGASVPTEEPRVPAEELRRAA